MQTDNVPLNVKAIFREKKVNHSIYDVARMRYLCKTFVEYILECQKGKQKPIEKQQTKLNAFEEAA